MHLRTISIKNTITTINYQHLTITTVYDIEKKLVLQSDVVSVTCTVFVFLFFVLRLTG